MVVLNVGIVVVGDVGNGATVVGIGVVGMGVVGFDVLASLITYNTNMNRTKHRHELRESVINSWRSSTENLTKRSMKHVN